MLLCRLTAIILNTDAPAAAAAMACDAAGVAMRRMFVSSCGHRRHNPVPLPAGDGGPFPGPPSRGGYFPAWPAAAQRGPLRLAMR